MKSKPYDVSPLKIVVFGKDSCWRQLLWSTAANFEQDYLNQPPFSLPMSSILWILTNLLCKSFLLVIWWRSLASRSYQLEDGCRVRTDTWMSALLILRGGSCWLTNELQIVTARLWLGRIYRVLILAPEEDSSALCRGTKEYPWRGWLKIDSHAVRHKFSWQAHHHITISWRNSSYCVSRRVKIGCYFPCPFVSW